MSENNRRINNYRGFTIVELLVIAPIVILTITAFISVIVNMTGDVLASRSSNVVAYDIQDALARIEEDVKLSSTFLAENTVTTAPPGDPILLPSPQGYGDDTTPFRNVDSTKGDILILNTFATSGNPITLGSSLIYLTNQPNACNSTQINQNTPMSLNIAYFVKNTSLWRRTIAPSNYDTAGCSVPWQQPSCAIGQTAAFCKTEDIKLLDNIAVSDFNVEYFTSADSTTANADASNVAKSVAERNAALQSSTTVGVSLNVTKTVAGREVSQSGSIRSTRLDINASSIAPVVVPTTPSAPVVTASYAAPNIVTFTWPSVPGAVSYTFQYQLNGTGGAWTTAFTGQNTTSFSVTTAAHGDVVYGRANATNAASPTPQTSAYSSNASTTIPIWVTPVLQNSWFNYGDPYATSAYTKTSAGLVVMKGLIKRNGTAVSGETLFTLPVGYRPTHAMVFSVNSVDVGTTLTVNVDGTVVPSTGVAAGFLSLETVVFYPTTYTGTWTNLSMLNSWSNRNLTNDPPFGYSLDSVGRMNVRGALTPGTQTDGTIINTPALAASNRPALYQHISLRSGGNGYNMVGVDTSGSILAKGGSAGSALFTNFSYLPTSYSGTWTNLPMVNGWVTYSGAYASPQYTKTSDGMVTLKGLIRSGTVTSGTIIGTLPAGFRPSKTALIDTICAGLFCRVDIDNAGNIIARAGVSATWTSLDGLTFLAEQ